MTIKEKMHGGELYSGVDKELMSEQARYLELLYDFNATRPSESEKRSELLKQMFAEIGNDCYIEPPLRANWGGKHVHFGNNVYANFNLTLVDDTTTLGANMVQSPTYMCVSSTRVRLKLA